MVEPEIAEKIVPATTATTARRPGTCAMSRSTPSITFTAMPVWNSTSPIRMKSGIGVREKLVIETTLFRASCCTPTSPPSQISAPAIFTAMKVKATGSPAKSSSVEPPSISHAANCHDIQAAETASSRGPRSPCIRRRMRNSISIASSANATGSGASNHHSGVIKVLIVIAPDI